MVELVVFRGVACDAPFSADLLKWLADVIQQACRERHDIRVRYVLLLCSSTLIKCYKIAHSSWQNGPAWT